MTRTRIVFLVSSVVVLALFSGLLLAAREPSEGVFRALGNLAEVVHLVKTQYVDEVDLATLGEGLEVGMAESADPDAAVLDDDQVKPYQEALAAPPPFGLVLDTRLSAAAVRQVLPGSPAEDAGLAPWEIIEAADGIQTRMEPLWRLRVELLKHERSGESVKLTVMNREVDERREVTLVPRPWQVQPAARSERDGVAVLTVTSLPASAAATLAHELEASPLVLDLRHLSWGTEESALAVADRFAASGLLGQWKGRRAGEREFKATAGAALAPPVVLVGPRTEGPGEILAAALARAGATLVGGETAGHAPHMMLVNDDDIHLWMPVAYWLKPDGSPLDGDGLEPDEKVAAAAKGDPALDRAVELAGQRHAAAA